MARLGIFLFVIFTTLAPAATEWHYGSSDHFEVYTTGGPGRARDALNYFERIHAFFTDALHVNSETKAPTRLIIFSNEKEYTPYRPNEGAFAFYQPGPDRDYIVMQNLSSETYPVVVHEYMHLVVKHGTKTAIPIWLNEGWAEFYSTVENRGGKMAVGTPPPGRLQEMVLGGKMMPLEKLFAVAHDSPEYNTKKHMGTFYAESWALTHMLLADSNYYKSAPAFLDLMLKGSDSATAVSKAYGKSLAQVTKDLEEYVHSGRYVLNLFDYKSPKARKDLETRETTPFEAALVTANLQAISPKGADEARAAFAKLEKENEAHLELQESIAYFEYRRGSRDAAIPHFARATELETKNWQLYRDYAFAVSDQAKRADLLGHAVGLNPDDIDTRVRYVDALMRDNRPGLALAALVPVTNIDKEHAFMFFQLSARANAGNQRMDDAKKAAERAVEYAASPTEKDYATRLLASLSRPEQVTNAAPVAVAGRQRDTESARSPQPIGGPDEDIFAARPRLVRRDPSEPPRLVSEDEVRKTNEAARLNDSDVVLEARFQVLDCAGAQPVMQFTTDAGPLRLSMNNPNTIMLLGPTGAATMNMNCGNQGNKPVRVGYKAGSDAKQKTTGDVRFLEYR